MAPRKVRLIARAIKGLDTMAAKSQLDHLVKRSSRPISKLLDSATANARNNFGLAKDNLFIKDIVVDEGMKLKRFRAKGFGSTSPVLKRTSRIKITLEEKVPGLKEATRPQKGVEPAEGERAEVETAAKETRAVAREKVKPEVKREIGKKGFLSGITRRFFRRKAI